MLPTAFGRVPELADLARPWLAGTFGRDVLVAEDPEHPVPILGQLPAEGRREMGHELDDVADAHPEVVAGLRADLDARLERLRARGAELGAGEIRAIDPERRKGLEELGYGGELDGRGPTRTRARRRR